MSFSLSSHTISSAACRQYDIDNSASVKLTLFGPKSYCRLKNIKDPNLKETLAKIGTLFEEQQSCPFFEVCHDFTPNERISSKTSEAADCKDNENIEEQVQDVLGFVNSVVAEQTDNNLTINVTDVSKLTVKKGIDLTPTKWYNYEPSDPCRAYEIEITIPEKVVETAEKLELVFREYGVPAAQEKCSYYILHVGM